MAISANAVAKGGVSPYLSLNQAPELEHQVQRLLAVSKNTHIMSKPYKAHDIYRVLQTVRHTYPELYQTLSYQLSPYIQSDAGTFAKVTLAAGTKDKTLPNQRGQTTKTNLIIEGGAYANFGRYFGVIGRYLRKILSTALKIWLYPILKYSCFSIAFGVCPSCIFPQK
ncbi:hypothetical protein H4J63_19790, partial [Pseudoalteromonas sp. 5Ae-yellow]|nr:hypothetical protein [Pseudoalteromonas sp. 5Ae-yellow]MDN3392172.1 hypothetical protein [Pseudoalteromonas sp. APC 3691]